MGCSPSYVGEIVAQAEKIPDRDMDDWIRGKEPSPWEEELRAASVKLERDLLPGRCEWEADMVNRLQRVFDYLRLMWGGERMKGATRVRRAMVRRSPQSRRP
jgi:hypothetical protein